jgi:glycerophosphoryl diester phosphodiesterase
MAEQTRPIVIAHRGASGYLPEHTLPAKALAFGMGADFLEQDVVLTKDSIPIVLHDIHLDTVTDVADRFPDRNRDDGRYYALDFTLVEVKQLAVRERFDRRTGDAVFAGRFPRTEAPFRIVSLSEEIEFVQGLNRSTGRLVGIYPEIKAPAWHRSQGQDISRIVLSVLTRYGYRRRQDPIYLQCFDPAELKRIRGELGCDLKLVQLIGENDWEEGDTDYLSMRTEKGLAEIAGYADGIGPRIEHLLADVDAEQTRPSSLGASSLVEWAHRTNLVVHPYTLRVDSLPKGITSTPQLLGLMFGGQRADGVFTDFPDVVVGYLQGAFGEP